MYQIAKKIIALVTVVCLSISFAVIPAGAADVDDLVTDEMIEYLADFSPDLVSPLSDTSGASIVIDALIVDGTPSLQATAILTGAGSPDTTYQFLCLVMEKATSTIVFQKVSDTFTATQMSWAVTCHDLEPEKTYSIGFFLVDGTTTVSGVNAVSAFDTPALATSVGNNFFAPIFNILLTLNNTASNQQTLLTLLLSQHLTTNNLLTTVNDTLTQIGNVLSEFIFVKLYQIEANTGQLVALLTPSAEENALKETTKETTQAVTDSLYADDAPTKVTVDDVKDVAQFGSAASSMFDSGVSVGSFFDALNNIRFIAFFSQETYDDLNTVPSISTYSQDGGIGYIDYYSENIDKIQKFVGGE